VEEIGVPEEHHWPVASHWQTLSQNIVWSSIHSIQWSIVFKLLRKCSSWGKPLIPMFRCGNGDILLSILPLSHRLGIVFYSVWFSKYQFNILWFLPVYCIPKIVSRYSGFEFLLFIVTWRHLKTFILPTTVLIK
jgi:hypothetical protein